MKKIIIIFICLLMAQPALAKTLKYRISDGEAIAIGSFKNMQEEPGTRVIYVDFEAPKDQLENYRFDGEKLVRKPQTEIDQKKEAKKQKRRDIFAKFKQKVGLTDEELLELGFVETTRD